uniref:Uncharacterized protein n=1 Tax=Brassica oleracea TaxID=3712 RepID=A0A3P6ELU1_BRAOL|nr:unnamed protein product [Brassica oleracea]
MKKGVVFDMESSRERSMGEGEVGIDTNSSLSCHVLWSFKELTLVPWLFTRSVLCSPSIQVEEEDFAIVKAMEKDLHTSKGHHLSLGETDDLKALELKAMADRLG